MASILTDLSTKFRDGNICIRLIYINVAIFVLTTLTGILFRLFNCDIGFLFSWIELPASVMRFLQQPWSIISYMFMHADVIHILFNMLWLYWFGNLFLHFFSARHLRGLYFLGGICGGILYMLAYNVFPFFSPSIAHSFALGASASVLAIVTAVAYRVPDHPIQLFLLGSLRLKYLALIVVGIDLLSITSSNAGGHIAHLGGAMAGIAFATGLNRGSDLTCWINRTIDGLSALFTVKPRRPKMKITPGGGRQQEYDYNARRKVENEEIDRILDKLKQSGYENLTTEEKKKLFDASKR